ncbi:hypothetical protein ACEE16_10460 [Streptococcus suis]
MVKVSVESKSDLLDLASSATIASERYREATASAYRSFQLRTNGGGGSALESFVSKINSLSEQVFQRYPEILSDYGSALDRYASSLEAEGFSGDIIYTKKDDIDGIVTWLTAQRYNSIDEKGDALDKAFQQASSVLSQDPLPVELGRVSTQSIVSDAYDDLQQLSKKRLSKHGKLTSALKVFKEDLSAVESSLIAIQSYLDNAHYVGQVPANTFIGWLTSGHLTAENMNLIDYIKDSGDDEMLDVLLNEGEDKGRFFTKLGGVDATHVSEGMMDLAYHRFLSNAQPGVNDKEIEKFFQSLQEQDVKAVQIYMEKMIFAGDKNAVILTAKAMEKVPPFPGQEASPEALRAYSAQWTALQSDQEFQAIHGLIEKGGILTSLFTSAHVHELGSDRFTKSSVKEEFSIEMSELTFDEKKKQYTWTRTRTDNFGGVQTSAIEANFLMHNDDVDTKQVEVKMGELDKKRQEAMVSFLTNMVALPANLIYPGAGTVISLTTDLLTSDGSASSKTKIGGGLAEMTIGDSYSAVEGAVGNASEMMSSYAALKDLAAQQLALKNQSQSIMFDGGGYSTVDDQGQGVAYYDNTYDLGANLARHDLDQNGLRAAVYRSHGGLEVNDPAQQAVAMDAVEAFDKFMAEKYDGPNQAYYSGLRGSSQDVPVYTDMDPTKVTDEVKNLISNLNDYKNYSDLREANDLTNVMDDMDSYRDGNAAAFDGLFP